MDRPLLPARGGEEEGGETGRIRREWWSEHGGEDTSTRGQERRRSPSKNGGRTKNDLSRHDDGVRAREGRDDPLRLGGRANSSAGEDFPIQHRACNEDDDDNRFGRHRLRSRPPTQAAEALRQQQPHPQHLPWVATLCRTFLALGGIANAALGSALLAAAVSALANKSHKGSAAAAAGIVVQYVHAGNSSSNSTDDGGGKGGGGSGSDQEDAGPVGLVFLSLAALHWGLVSAACAALPSYSIDDEDEEGRREIENDGPGDEEDEVGAAYEIVNLDAVGDEDEGGCVSWCCCCCCAGGDSGGLLQRHLCGTAILACLSALTSVAYAALGAAVGLNIVSCGSALDVPLVPDLVRSHFGLALLAAAAWQAVQSRAALAYHRQLRLLAEEEGSTAGAAAPRRRRRRRRRRRPGPSRRPWWWTSSSAGADDRPDREPQEEDEDEGGGEGSGGGWFGWVRRRQGRKASASSRPFLMLFGSSRHSLNNPRDDGSVDFASVQEEWLNRSMEDPHWWSRDEQHEPEPSPFRKGWDQQDNDGRLLLRRPPSS